MTRHALIRVDANPEIGLGHLSRCLSLAHAFSALEVKTTFVVRQPDPAVSRKVQESGHSLFVLPASIEPGSAADADAVAKLIEGEPVRPILVVDHYAVDQRWETPLRARVDRLAVIDDLANRRHDCDVLIDQNRMFDADVAYRQVLNGDATRLIGPRFALLRPEFAERREKTSGRGNAPLPLQRRVVVSFGGADAAGHTLAVMQALKPFLHDLDRVDVLLSSSNRHCTAVKSAGSADDKFFIHTDSAHVAEVFGDAMLAIGAGGVTSWERACLSVPSIVFGIVPNQFQNVRELLRAGLAIGVPEMLRPDSAVIVTWIQFALRSPDMLRGMAERCGSIVDGLGARRVASRLSQCRLQFRRAVGSDSATLYAWRNHPAIRAVSLNPHEISRGEHELWFERSLANGGRLILMAEEQAKAVGVVRFDFSGHSAIISVYKNPDHKGRVDIIGQVTHWLFKNRPDINEVAAVVLADNVRSIAAFQSAGYQLQEHHFVALRDQWRLKPENGPEDIR